MGAKGFSKKQSDILSIQVRILGMLSEICGLTQDEITDIIDRTDLFNTIKDMYFMLHQEGDYMNMIHI